MNFMYLAVLSVLYILVQSQDVEIQNQTIQYNALFKLNNHSNVLDNILKKETKINFNDYLLKEPLFNNVINIENVLKDSDILYQCDKNIPNLNKTIELNHVKKYPTILLCMGLAHVLMLIGVVLTQQQIPDPMLLRLPKSKSDLDSLISIMNANNTLKNNVMCEQHKVTLPSYSSDVVEYVKILNPLLDNTSNCKRVCLDFGNDINPICALLIEANSIFYNLLKQYNQNSNQVENIDSAKALEQNSDVDKTTIITTKGITDNLKKEVINTISKDNITKSHNVNNNSLAVTNDSNIAGSVNSIHDETKVQKQVVEQNSTSTTTSIDKKDDESLINVNVNSAEITDDDIDGDYNVEKQTSKNPDNITETKIIPSTKGTIPSEPTDKVVLVVDEDNAKEAVNEPETPETKKIEKPEVTVEQSSTKKEKTRPSKTSKTTEIEIKEKSKLGNNLDETLPPPLKNPPVADVPNIDTLEGDNNAAVNNDEEEAFSSNVDNRNYKQQGDDPGESLLDPQENTPYVIPDGFEEAEDSHFFTYFVIMFVVCIVMYLVFYNKRKLLALALEGRHAGNRRSRSRRGGTYSRVNTGFDESKEHLLY